MNKASKTSAASRHVGVRFVMTAGDATIRDASIRTALPSQEDLKARREHCSVDGRLLGSLGAARGQQIRIRRTATEYALYTVSERRDEDDADVVRLGLTGRRRLGTDDTFAGAVVLPAADPTLSERDAERRGELVERLDDDGEHRGLIAIAPHGGDIHLVEGTIGATFRISIPDRPVELQSVRNERARA